MCFYDCNAVDVDVGGVVLRLRRYGGFRAFSRRGSMRVGVAVIPSILVV